MKLKYVEKYKGKKWISIALFIIGLLTLIPTIICFKCYPIYSAIINLLSSIFCFIFAWFFAFGVKIFAKVSIDPTIKDKGVKGDGMLLSTIDCDEKMGCLTFDYKGKIMYVCFVENDDCYKKLVNLLKQNDEALSNKEGYIDKLKIKIPIDIYEYKKKIYVDLDSLELEKIEGFLD